MTREEDAIVYGNTNTGMAFGGIMTQVAKQSPVTSTPKWVPCSKQLPKENEYYLVQNEYGDMLVAKYVKKDYWEEIYSRHKLGATDKIVAWMPLPKKYKAETKKGTCIIMKKRMKLIGLMLSTVLLMGTFAGCSYTDTEEYVPKDTQTDTLKTTKNSNSTVSVPNLTQDLPVHGEEFSLICKYDTGKYSLKNWHVTDAKSINMDVHTKNLPDGYDVLVEHMHADISLASTSTQINGITQDSMDNSFHGNTQDGFAIDDKTSYYRTFAIEGYTDQFYQLWGYACGDFGVIDSSYERLTESHIIKVGTYAERLSVVYDLAIKHPGDKKYHSASVKSELLIPVSQNVRKKTVECDVFE